MDKDTKPIGYAVKIGDMYLSSCHSIPVFDDFQYTVACNKPIVLSKESAKELAEEVNGKVVELYAREVEDSEDEEH